MDAEATGHPPGDSTGTAVPVNVQWLGAVIQHLTLGFNTQQQHMAELLKSMQGMVKSNAETQHDKGIALIDAKTFGAGINFKGKYECWKEWHTHINALAATQCSVGRDILMWATKDTT